MELVKNKKKKSLGLTHQNMMLYGAPKAGKTTLCAEAKSAKVLFAATEKGHDAVEAYVQPIQSWPEFLKLCTLLATEKHDYNVLCVDVVDWLYRHCESFICQQHNVQHVTDLSYGKGSALVKNEFIRVINKLNSIGIGLWFLSHGKDKTKKTKTSEWTQMDTTLPASSSEVICGLCDYIFFIYVDDNGERWLRTKGTKYINAGDRSGMLPEKIKVTREKNALDIVHETLTGGEK